jgi:hypothetical protein
MISPEPPEAIQKPPTRERRHKKRRRHQSGPSGRSSDDEKDIRCPGSTTMLFPRSPVRERRLQRRRQRERGNSSRRSHWNPIPPVTSSRQNGRTRLMDSSALGSPHRIQHPRNNHTPLGLPPSSVKLATRLKRSNSREAMIQELKRIAFGDLGEEDIRLDHAARLQPGSTEYSPFLSLPANTITHRSGRPSSQASQPLNYFSHEMVYRHGNTHTTNTHSAHAPTSYAYSNHLDDVVNRNLDGRNPNPYRAVAPSSATQRYPPSVFDAEHHQSPRSQPLHSTGFSHNPYLNIPAYGYY